MDLLHSKTTQPSTAVSGTFSTEQFQPKPVSPASQASKKSLIDEYSRSSTSAESLKKNDKRKRTGRSLEDMEVFKHPMCLISTESVMDAKGEIININFKEEQEVLNQIKQIDLPMVIVAVVGLYPTDKSYLMSQLAESTKGYELGGMFQSKTKGIWVWCKMHPKIADTVLMLLDTEDLDYFSKRTTIDKNKRFTFATLLCHCLIYNMKVALESYAVSKLEYVKEMAKNIRYHGESSEDNKALSLILPDFFLCVRDFRPNSRYKGKKILPVDYLTFNFESGDLGATWFKTSQACIRKYFQKHMCFEIPKPGGKDDDNDLKTLEFSDLSDRFKDAISLLVSHIYRIPPKKLLARKPVNGRMFVTLVDNYVTAIKHGGVLDVDYAFEEVAKNETASIEKEAVDMFVNEMKEMFVSTDNLGYIYTNAQSAALDFFRRNAVSDPNGRYEKQAQDKMDKVWNIIIEKEEQIRNERYRYRNEQDERKRQLETEREKAIRDAEIYLKQEKERQDEQRRNKENIDKLLKEHQTAQLETLDKQTKLLYNHLEFERRKYELLLEEKMKLVKEESQRENERYRKELEETKKQLETEREKTQMEAEIYRKKDEDIQDEKRRNKENIDKVLKEHQTAQLEALDKQTKLLYNHLEIERRKYELLLEEKMKLVKEESQRENGRYRKELEETKKQLETEKEKAQREAEIYQKKDEDIPDEQKRNNRNMIKLLKDHQYSYMEALDKQKQMLENLCNKLDKRFNEQLEIERKIFTDLIHEKGAVQKDNERYRKEVGERMKQSETETDLAEREAEK